MEETENFNNIQYIIIPNYILTSQVLTPNDKILYSLIMLLSNNKLGVCFCSNEFLSKLCNLSIRQIQNILSKLQKYDYIKVSIKENKRYIYTPETQLNEKNKYKERVRQELIDYDWLGEEE